MGYVCPVCGDPQADGHHLANHLAFTAMLDGGEHETWLDEHAPDWGDADPAELAATVTGHAEESDYPQVFEDTTDDADHDHGQDPDHAGHDHSDTSGGQSTPADVLDGATPGETPDPSELFDAGASDGDADDVLAEARELTRQRRVNTANGAETPNDGEETSEADDATEDATDRDATEDATDDEDTADHEDA